jgi:hypothetical protein
MTNDEGARAGPRLETITSNFLKIERGSLIAGNVSFQIRNIASLFVNQEESKFSFGPFLAFPLVVGIVFAFLLQSAGGFIVGAIIGAGIAWFIERNNLNPPYQLQLLTNAATSFRIIDKDQEFLLKLKTAIEEVMHRGDNAVAYTINIAEQKIERIEANTTHVSHSPGAAVIGGSAFRVNQSTNVAGLGTQDIIALIEIVQRSDHTHKDFYEYHLDTVKRFLEGQCTKEEAKTSWAKFLQHASQIAGAGNNAWELIGRIGALLV